MSGSATGTGDQRLSSAAGPKVRTPIVPRVDLVAHARKRAVLMYYGSCYRNGADAELRILGCVSSTA